MNRSTLVGFLAGLLFAASLIGGALLADALRDDGGGELEIPSAGGERIPLISGEDVTGLDSEPILAADAGYVPTEVAGEFVLLDEAPPAGEIGGGLADDVPGAGPAASDPAGDGGGDDTPGVSVAGEPPPGEDRGYPWEVEDLDFSILDLLFEDSGFPFLRFFDFCADSPDAEGCPPGTGGTVLVPVDDELAVGDFELHDLYRYRGERWWTCEAPSDLGPNEYFMMLSASQPARIEIDYYPQDDPGAVRSTVVDLTDPTNPLFGDFLATVTETGGPPLTGVHHCFVLEAEPLSQLYFFTARATSFTGETDVRTYQLRTDERRTRPPVRLASLNDYEATLVVPVKSEPRQRSLVRLIAPDEGLGCTDIEDASVVTRERRRVVPREPGELWWGPSGNYSRRERIPNDVVDAPDWRYDSSYDANEFWRLNLEEGTSYRACIWWVESPDRSYDPVSTGIADRETMYITTPDRLRAAITVAAIEAPSSRDVTAGSFTLSGRTKCRALELPTAEIRRGTGVTYPGGIPFCDYLGTRQPAFAELTATLGETNWDFVVATPNTGEPRTEQVRLDLSQGRTSGLCGSSFGDCDPPTSVVPGPIVYLDVEFTEGSRSGQSGWVRGFSSTFESPARETPEFPEQLRMDEFSSRVEAERRDALRVTANFDRPVTLAASLEGDLDAQCFTGDVPTYSSDELRASYVFVLDGLCTFTYYYVRLEATDEAGSTVVFTNTPSGTAGVPREWVWGGDARTLGYDVRYYPAYVTSIISPIETFAFDVRVGGSLTELTGDDRCLSGRITPWRTTTWGEEIPVEILVRIGRGFEVDGRCTADPGSYLDETYEASITTSFTIEQFLAGPIEIPIPLEPTTRFGPSFPDDVVRVRILGGMDPWR